MKVDIDEAVVLLQNWWLVAFPTETVYGLGALATHAWAVDNIFTIKRRPQDNPLICHFSSVNQIMEYTSRIPSYWDVLVSHFSPWAVSYLLPCRDDRLRAATRGSTKVLCRIPNHPLALKLLDTLDQPLVWPSANISGHPSATNASMVEDYFGNELPVIDGGSSWIGLESTIIDCSERDRVTLFRPWQVGIREIRDVLERSGHKITVEIGSIDHHHVVPGTKYRHYSPSTIIFKVPQRNSSHDRTDIAIIGPTEMLERITTTQVSHRIDLGSIYTPGIIAHDLYHKLHELDTLGVRHAYLIMRHMGESSIESALADRLEKVWERRDD